MSIILEEDFHPDFLEDYDRDVDLIIDRTEEALVRLERKYREPFSIILNEPELITKGCGMIEKTVDQIMRGSNERISRVIDDVVSLCWWGLARAIMDKDNRVGDDRLYEIAERETEDNPIMREGDRGSRRDRGRDNRRDDRGPRRNRRERETGRYGKRRQGQSRHRVSTGEQSRHNVGTGLGKRRSEREEVRDDRNYYERPKRDASEERKPRTPRDEVKEEIEVNTTTLNDGDIVTCENNPLTNPAYPTPVYVLAIEKTIIKEGKLTAVEYERGEKVDYEKHRVDKIYPEALMTEQQVQLQATLSSIREAQTALDSKISSFINNPETNEQEIDSKLLKHARSFTLEVVMDQVASSFDPIDIRDQILEQHGGDIKWLTRNAMIVNANHVINVSRDKDINRFVDTLTKGNTYLEIANALIHLSHYIDPSRWLQLHNAFTAQLNYILVVDLGLEIVSDSITGDLKELVEFFKTLDAQQQLVVKAGFENFGKKFEKVIDVEDEEMISIKHKHRCVYLPIPSSDLAIATAGNDLNVGRLDEGTKLFSLVSRFQQNPVDATDLFITIDGKMIELCTPAVDTGLYFDVRFLN